MSVLVSVIVPTVTGREAILEKCLDAYNATVPTRLEIVVIRNDGRTCGEGWEEGARLSHGNVLHFTADDLIPREGWLEAGLSAIVAGALPGCTLWNEDGTRWDTDGADGTPVGFPRVPLLHRDLYAKIAPIPALHYYSDIWLGHAASAHGWPTSMRERYAFTHLWAPEGRVHDPDPDRRRFERLLAKLTP